MIKAASIKAIPPESCEIPDTKNGELLSKVFLLRILATTVHTEAPTIRISPIEKLIPSVL
jgi:hypothetical protein